MSKKPPIKPWHTVLCVLYHGMPALLRYQEPIRQIVKNVAFVKDIECAIVCGNDKPNDTRSLSKTDPSDIPPDYIHFRAERRPLISRMQFEKLIIPLLPYILDGVDPFFLYQYEVKEMPFPSKNRDFLSGRHLS